MPVDSPVRHSGAVEAHFERASALFSTNRFDEAVAAFDAVLAIDPGLVPALINRGAALRNLGRAKEALASYEQVLAASPHEVIALDGRAVALCDLGRHEEGLATIERALRANPGFAPAQVHAALIRLRLGDFERGLPLYESRWQGGVRGLAPRDMGRPRWDGKAAVRGRSLLIHAEQGLGDTVQFLRYVPLLARQGASVVLQVPAALAGLAQTLEGSPRVVVQGEALPPTDYHCPLLSLPLAMRTTLRSIPATVPYLQVDGAAAAQWRKKLARGGDKLVGVSWRGSSDFASDALRSIPFRDFARLLDVPGIRFVSLQKEMQADEQALAGSLDVAQPGESFQSTAELVAGLDLVISMCSVWSHVAGALARPVWVLLHSSPHWTWLLGRPDSPWYPTARLYRQQRPGDWPAVIEAVRHGLIRWCKTV